MRTLSAIVLFASLSCSSSTDEGDLDPRYGLYMSEGVDAWNPIVLWERGDGIRFEVTGGWIDCFEDNSLDSEVMDWQFVEPDGVRITSGQWSMGEVRCDLAGTKSLQLSYVEIGDIVLTSNETVDGKCVRLAKRLPRAEVIEAGRPFGDYPPIIFGPPPPDPMPELTYKRLFGC
ncbi:MAG: hypothetical protein KJN92_11515 [Gemmatimonadetes bacterium]|nr:hypothetical protein [Gemmatimonadota bacterium]